MRYHAGVVEFFIAGSSVVVLMLLAWIPQALAPQTLFFTSLSLVLLGLLFGIPSGLMYHLRLIQRLRRRIQPGARWWLHPVSLHQHLSDADRRQVMPWFYIGASSMMVILLGCALLLLMSINLA